MRDRIRLIILVLLLSTLQILTVAFSDDRIALVIGNSDYPVSPLRNPVNDANDIANRLQELGFEVIHYENTTHLQMENAVREFGNLLDEIKGIGIFFYAGHGLQVNGRNYLIPVDADIQDETEVKHKALDVDFVLGKMELAQNNVNLLILDACRNNPFERSFRSTSSRGLAPMNAPSGTVIWYATRPGKVASDGQGRNSPFTRNLLSTLNQRNVEARKVISQIAVSMRNEKLQQEPWQEGIWLSDFYFLKEDSAQSINQVNTYDAKAEAEKMHWRIIKDLDQVDAFENYLSKCDKEFTCLHKHEAYKKLALLMKNENNNKAEQSETKNKTEQPVVLPKKVIDKPVVTKNTTLAKVSFEDIYDENFMAGSRELNLQQDENIEKKLEGSWQCKWKDAGNRVLDKVVWLDLSKVTNKSFRGLQSMASPFCTEKWYTRGKISNSRMSYKLVPTTATSSPSCKAVKSYTGIARELNSGAIVLDLKFSSVLSQDRGLMRCKKAN